MDEESFQFMLNCSSDIDYGEDNATKMETESDAAQQSSSAKTPSPIIFATENPTKFLSRQNNPESTSTSAEQNIDSRTPAQINPLTSCSRVEEKDLIVQPSASSQNVMLDANKEGCTSQEMAMQPVAVQNAQPGGVPKVAQVLLQMRNADEVLVRWQPGPSGVEAYADEWVPLNLMRQAAPQLVIDFLLHKMQYGTVKDIGKMY